MPEADRKLRVFLCHASQDKPAVRELSQRLKKEGWIDPWLDEEKLTFGQYWTTAIEDALHEADIVIIFLSRNSVQKEGFVQRELNYAWELSLEKPRHVIFLIPFRLDDCEIPRYLSSRQWGDYFGEKKESTYQILLRSLKQRHEQKLQLEAEERARFEAEEKKRKEAEELKRKQDEEAQEKARLDAEEKKRKEAEELKRKQDEDAEEKARLAALEKERLESEERKRKQAEEKERKEKEARERKAEVERARKAAEEQAKKEARERKAAEPKTPQAEKPVDQPVEYKVSLPERRGDSYRPEKRPSYALYLGGAGILVTLICLIFGVNYLIQNVFAKETPAPTGVTPLFTAIYTPTRAIPTATPAPTKTSLPPTPTHGIGTMVSPKDGMMMMYVPAGEFTMGSDTGASDEMPVHKVSLNAFWIDQTEITNAMYAKCMQDGYCNQPSTATYYSDTKYADHPVVYVSWNDANAYCSWADRRLPTEAEWEKAARGTDGRTYPWGENINCDTANYSGKDNGNSACIGDTTPVGNYADISSPYGTYDMAGNVLEWTADWYDVYPGGDPNISFNFGQTYRVLRGGSWDLTDFTARSSMRIWYAPTFSYSSVGFRCAMSASK